MKIEDFKKLETAIQEQDFNRSFKNINNVMFYLSIFGHCASIFLAYFLVSKILSGAITDNIILVTISSIILLGGLELLKREIFDKFSLQQIKNKSLFNKDVLPLFLVSAIIISISFYASISGAHEFSNKSQQIEVKIENDVKIYEDSLTNMHKQRLTEIESEIDAKKLKIEDKDKEQTAIETNSNVTRQQRQRVQDLKSEKNDLKKEIKELEGKIDQENQRLKDEIKQYEQELVDNGKNQKEENKSNSFLFVIISTMIELVILAGVYFNEYYKFRSYDEFKKKIDNDTNFQKWFNYNSALDIIYNNETKINDKLPSGKAIQDLCKVNGIILLNKDITEMFKLFGSLGIVKTSGSAKYINKSKESAKELIKTHFKVE